MIMPRFWILLALMMPAVSAASDWYYFAETNLGDLYYIDASSISTQRDGTKKAWFTRFKEDGTYNKKLESFKCNSKEADSIHITNYNKDGRVLSSNSYEKREYTSIVPDTVGELQLKIVCSKSPITLLKSVGGKINFSPEGHAKLRKAIEEEAPSAEAAPPAIDLTHSESVENKPIFPPVTCKDNCAKGFYWAQQYNVNTYQSCGEKSDIALIYGCFEWVKIVTQAE